MGQATTTQTRYRWRNDDGSESGASWKAAINTGWTPGASDLDVPIRLRIEIANTGNKDEDSGQYLLYLDKSGGGYSQITTTSTNGVKMVASGYVTDDVVTTEQMAGSQTFVAGRFDSNGASTALVLPQARDTEYEFCFKLDSANLSGGETLSFRVYHSSIGAIDGYTVTPSITAPSPPSGEWTQAEFRIRAGGRLGDTQGLNDNGAGDWAAAANANATMQPDASRWGTVFGLRFKVSAAVASSSKTLKIQTRKNGGTWGDLTAENHNDQLNLVNSIPIGIIPSIYFTDGAATSQLLSGSSFVAGTGEHSGTAASVTLGVGDHTELEWRIFINKLWENCGNGHIDGDYYDFRLVESDGTPLTGYTYTPRVTLDYDNNYIGGCYPESIGRYGIFYASDGDAFTVVEQNELAGQPAAVVRANGQTEWTVMDQLNAPYNILDDLECFHIHQVGNTLHLFYLGGDVRYETIDMANHQWGQLAEQVDSTGGGTNQVVAGFRRSDGTTICIYTDASDNLVYKERSSGGTWDSTPTTIYSGTYVTGAAAVLGASDKIYIVWNDNEATIYSRSLDSSNTLGTQRTISTDPVTTGSGEQWSLIAPVYWDDSGTEKIGVIYQRGTDEKLYWKIISNDGAPGTESVVTDYAVADNEVALNSRQPAAQALTDGSTIYVGYARAGSDYDLYYTTSTNGASFGTDIEVEDGRPVFGVGMGFTTGTLAFITEEPNPDTIGNPQLYAGYSGGIQVKEVTLEVTDDLTANSISTTPTVGNPTLTSTAALTASSISTTPVVGNPTLSEIVDLPAPNDISTTPTVGNPSVASEADLIATSISTTPTVGNPTLTSTADLDANDISTTPVVGNPTLSETAILDANDISTTPVVGNPDIGSVADLDANDISTTPVVGTPDITSKADLDANDISTTPVVGTPDITSGVGLSADSISTTPTVGNPSIGQTHVLDANDILTTPAVDNPILGTIGEDNLTADSISTTPVVGTPDIGQEHALTSTGISTTPVVGMPTAEHIHNLTPTGISTTPAVGTPTATHIHNLTPTGITTTPVVDNPILGSIGEDNLAADSISTTPVVGTPDIGQEHDLTATGVSTTPVVGTPTLSSVGEDNLDATGITTTPVVDTPDIGQEHSLGANSIATTPVVGTPTLSTSGIDNLTADSIATTPVVGTPSIGQIHALAATGITTTPVVGTPSIGQIHTLDSVGITTTPVVDNPTASEIFVLTAVGITTNPVVGTPSIGQTHILSAESIAVSPVVGNTVIGQTHILTASGIMTIPELGIPNWDLIEGIVIVAFSVMYPETDFSVIKPEITFTIPMED